MLDQIRRIESTDGRYLIGDGGRARGPYQFHFNTWEHVHLLRKRQSLSAGPEWFNGAMNEQWSRAYAQTYLEWIAQTLQKKLGWCSQQTIYASWNVGVYNVIKVKGDVRRLGPRVQQHCLRFSAKRFYPEQNKN